MQVPQLPKFKEGRFSKPSLDTSFSVWYEGMNFERAWMVLDHARVSTDDENLTLQTDFLDEDWVRKDVPVSDDRHPDPALPAMRITLEVMTAFSLDRAAPLGRRWTRPCCHRI